MNHIELGQKGEEIAVEHLQKTGYSILDRNFKFKKAEIDIVCQKNEQLIIVEVKTRHTAVIGEPYLAVTRSKQRQIIKVANKYIEEKKIDLDVRLDVVSIVLNQYGMRLEHIEDAFYP
ncbi:MAG: YraN family protein [Fluviicola sp.]|nr:YraN family protein [Fluviicola sp.]